MLPGLASVFHWFLPAAYVGATVFSLVPPSSLCRSNCLLCGISWDSGMTWGYMGSRMVSKAAAANPKSGMPVQHPLWKLPPREPASSGSFSVPSAPLVQHLLPLFQICQSHKSCEIDPVKLKDGENLENNMVRHLLCSGTLPKAGHLVGILLVAVWVLFEDLSQGRG